MSVKIAGRNACLILVLLSFSIELLAFGFVQSSHDVNKGFYKPSELISQMSADHGPHRSPQNSSDPQALSFEAKECEDLCEDESEEDMLSYYEYHGFKNDEQRSSADLSYYSPFLKRNKRPPRITKA